MRAVHSSADGLQIEGKQLDNGWHRAVRFCMQYHGGCVTLSGNAVGRGASGSAANEMGGQQRGRYNCVLDGHGSGHRRV